MTRFAMLIAFVFMWAGSAMAATFEICVKVDIQTTDSALTANGITEDKWVGADHPNQYLVIGRGFRVKVRQGEWADTFDSDPATGCFTFQRNSAQNFAVRVYGFATDSGGNHVRIHDAGGSTTSWYPGNTYSTLWTGQTLSSSEANEYVLDGRASDRWTTIAAAAFGLYRYHDGNSGKTVSIGFAESQLNSPGLVSGTVTDTCGKSTSIHGNAEHYIESHDAHLLRIGRCPSTASDAREKFIVTHELGHAMLRLYYGFDGDDSPRDQTYQPPGSVNNASPAQGSSCVNVAKYTMNSLEWNSQAFKEGYAEFYSAKVWNVKEARGTYVSRQTAYDLEKWDNVGDVNTSGGFKENFCWSSASGVTTMSDILRFLWDFYTLTDCSDQPNRRDMFRIYRAVRVNHRDGIFTLTTSNYHDALKYAIENSVPTLSSCEIGRYDFYAGWNALY